MAVTAASFRQQFNEFANPDLYSDFAINSWVTLALLMLDPARWDVMLDYGTSLFVAHRLALARADVLASLVSGTPGAPKGVLTSKSIDKVSASYDAASITLEGAGQYNMTRYGIELWQLMGQMGAGGLQISGDGGDGSNGAWYGFY